MRVSIISSSFFPATFYGGPVSSTWDLSQRLAKNNIEVFVSTTNANGTSRLDVEPNVFIKKHDNLYVKYYHEEITNKISFKYIFGVFSDIRKSDVIYIQYLFHYTVLFAIFYAFFCRKKIVICPRGSFSDYTLKNKFTLLKYLWIFFFIKPFKNIIFWHASSYLEKIDIKKNIDNAHVNVINDGIDFDLFQDVILLTRKKLIKKYTNRDFDSISHVFFSMGRLHPIKGFDIVINAFEIFLDKYPNAKLLIAGPDDGFQNEIEKMISHKKLLSSIFLIGKLEIEDKKIVLTNSDFFILGSHFESFGIVIAESLSCGTPAIVSNRTSWKKIEINNCGIFTEPNYSNFYDAMKKCVEMKFDSSKIKQYAKSNFDWSVILKKFINLLTKN